MEKTTVIKLVLSILLVVCVFDMPYGFYQLVRFIALIGFGILAFNANQENKKTELIIYVSLALLFQPFIKISLGRDLWNIVDIIVGIGLLTTIFLKFDKLKKP